MILTRRKYFVLALMWREWWIGTRYDFMRDAWHYNVFGLSLFINNEFWWLLSGKRRKAKQAEWHKCCPHGYTVSKRCSICRVIK